MEVITLRVDSSFADEMNKAMHPLYSTKTEFIREAIRDKIRELKKEENTLRNKKKSTIR